MDAHEAIVIMRLDERGRSVGARSGPSRYGPIEGQWRPSGRSWSRLPCCPAFLALGLFLSLAAGCGRSEPETARPSDPPAEGTAAGEAEATATTLPTEKVRVGSPRTRGEQLYTVHCAACHGESGDGNGPAAPFLYPRPRNFREGQFRLVTTTNRVPSDEDLMRVLERGMPGSAMFPFGHLDEADQAALVREVRRLVREGLEHRLRLEAEEFGVAFDPEELAEILATRAEPGPPLEIPENLSAFDEESVARGRLLYTENCASCHGETGKGDGVEEQNDNLGMPIRPRDFTRGIFKGGREPEQLYARIVLGAPGTPMPASPSLEPEDVGDLINFILALSDAPSSSGVEHRRTRLVAHRVSESLPEAIPDSSWDAIEPTPIVVSPIWWRPYDPPDLHVQAMHDGRALAVRLTWRDESQDDEAVRPQDFPDKVALQLFRGENEPFLGMGATDGAVDIWLWDASSQKDLKRYADVDSAYPNMAVDMYPFEDLSDGDGDHPTDRQSREFLTAWAAGNPRSDPTRPQPGSSLQARGFGTLTTHPAASPSVEGQGAWNEGRWTVVLRRPLRVSPETELPLAVGDRLSVAFALWDGAARDRDGQKLISIWHDLELEDIEAAQAAPTIGARR